MPKGAMIWAGVDCLVKILLIALCAISLPFGAYKGPLAWYIIMIIMNLFLILGIIKRVSIDISFKICVTHLLEHHHTG
jgi:hypothetical protein